LKMRSRKFWKKKKNNFFFFIFVDEIDFFSFWWKTKFFLQRNYLYENGLGTCGRSSQKLCPTHRRSSQKLRPCKMWTLASHRVCGENPAPAAIFCEINTFS
jgi:hypothetical protein